jgi:hypothetical protein
LRSEDYFSSGSITAPSSPSFWPWKLSLGTQRPCAIAEQGLAQVGAQWIGDPRREVRRQGWGDTKIARWLAEQAANRKRRARKRGPGSRSRTAEEWRRLLVEVLASGQIPWVGLLLHWYSGSFQDDEVRFSRASIPLTHLCDELLLQFEEDVLYQFRAVP